MQHRYAVLHTLRGRRPRDLANRVVSTRSVDPEMAGAVPPEPSVEAAGVTTKEVDELALDREVIGATDTPFEGAVVDVSALDTGTDWSHAAFGDVARAGETPRPRSPTSRRPGLQPSDGKLCVINPRSSTQRWFLEGCWRPRGPKGSRQVRRSPIGGSASPRHLASRRGGRNARRAGQGTGTIPAAPMYVPGLEYGPCAGRTRPVFGAMPKRS